MQEMPLEKLLDAMCYPASSYHYEKAWREFLRRYQARMLRAIKKVCLGWRVNRLRMQLDEVVNDVFGGVLNLLIRNDLRALKQFESRDNENRFIAWLTIVSMNETKRELRRRFRDYFSEEEIGDLGRTEVGDAVHEDGQQRRRDAAEQAVDEQRVANDVGTVVGDPVGGRDQQCQRRLPRGVVEHVPVGATRQPPRHGELGRFVGRDVEHRAVEREPPAAGGDERGDHREGSTRQAGLRHHVREVTAAARPWCVTGRVTALSCAGSSGLPW